MSHPNAVVPPTQRVPPTPIYESLLYLLIFIVLWRQRRRPHPPASLFGQYLVLTGIVRFAVEFVRRNPVVALGLTVAQWRSLVSIAIGVAVLLRAYSTSQPIAEREQTA